jgi:hypothetical protein
MSSPGSSSQVVERLRAAVLESGSPLQSSLGAGEVAAEQHELAPRAAAGPRVAQQRADVEVAVAAVEEGYRLHYGHGRALDIDDGDLALLAGDRMYALGLARLAAIGDMAAIAELADVISLSAQAHAGEDPELAGAAWEAAAAAIAAGSSPLHAEAKRRAREGDPRAADALREAARG